MTEGAGAGVAPPRPEPGRGPVKGPAAFRTISEASAEVGVPQHVLRFWETRFAFIRPTKRAGGRRFYRPQDLEVLRGVRALLQDEGYTIKGVQKLHKEQGLKRLLSAAGVGEAAAADLASSVETWELEAADAPARPAAAEPAEGDARPDDEPETGDLFAVAPVASALAARPAEPPPEARPPRARPVLDAAARARLAEVLGDLEATKAEIDALLHEG